MVGVKGAGWRGAWLGLALYACGSSGNGEPGSSNGASTGDGNSGATSGSHGANGTGGDDNTGGNGGGNSGTDGELPQIGGCTVFDAADAWNRDISSAPVSADWTARLQALVGDVNLHPDYGNDGATHYGIPINVVPQDQALAPVTFEWYEEESDPGPYPFPGPDEVLIEGESPTACDGDCHLLVVRQGECVLYEGYACEYRGGRWHCGNGAMWDLTRASAGQRSDGFTSADAAGLPIAPGLVRYDEVRAGEIRHAIRFTLHCSAASEVPPATHHAVPDGCEGETNAPPMGLRVRLKADYDVSALSPSAQVVARAMKTYGMILADNGSDFYFQGDMSDGWTEDDIEPLKSIPASAFEALEPE